MVRLEPDRGLREACLAVNETEASGWTTLASCYAPVTSVSHLINKSLDLLSKSIHSHDSQDLLL